MSPHARYWRRQLVEAAIAAPIIGAVIVLSGFRMAFGCVIGGVFVLVGLVLMGRTLWMSRVGEVAQGTVVDHEKEEGCYFPVVEFRDLSGVARRERADLGRGVRRPAVGSRVVVIYAPKGKMPCQILTFGARFGLPLVVMAIGVIVLALVLIKR